MFNFNLIFIIGSGKERATVAMQHAPAAGSAKQQPSAINPEKYSKENTVPIMFDAHRPPVSFSMQSVCLDTCSKSKNGVCDDGRSKGELKRFVLCDLGTVSDFLPTHLSVTTSFLPLNRIVRTVALGMHLVQSHGQEESSPVDFSSWIQGLLLSWKVKTSRSGSKEPCTPQRLNSHTLTLRRITMCQHTWRTMGWSRNQ